MAPRQDKAKLEQAQRPACAGCGNLVLVEGASNLLAQLIACAVKRCPWHAQTDMLPCVLTMA